jgi:hypothetical protein
MGTKSEQIIKKATAELIGSREKDLRFLRVEEYFRMIDRSDAFSATCQTCKNHLSETEIMNSTIRRVIDHPGNERRQYDRLIDEMSKHQRKEHGFYPPFYFNYLYSFYGIVGGTAAGAVVWLPFSSLSVWYFLVPAISFGLLAGQLIGGKKDARIRANNKIL